METIRTTLEPDFKGELSQQDYKDLEQILKAGETLYDVHRHYNELFIDEVHAYGTRFYEKYRGELQPSFAHISDKLLVVLLTKNVAHGRAEIYRNDNAFAIEVEID